MASTKTPDIPAFHAFTIKYTGKVKRIVTKIKISQAFEPDLRLGPPDNAFETDALWDTGATASFITRATAEALGLVPVGTVMVNHAGGAGPASTYLVNYYLPNNVGVAGVLVSDCQNIAGDFGAIIGMDIIGQSDLSITNVGGQTWMTFRIPSVQAVDFVAEANKIRYAGVDRNDPCPCGKKTPDGKPVKFKHCHMKSV